MVPSIRGVELNPHGRRSAPSRRGDWPAWALEEVAVGVGKLGDVAVG